MYSTYTVPAVVLLVLTNLLLVECRGRKIRTLCKTVSKSRIDLETADGVKIEAIPSSKVYIDSFKIPFHNRQSLSFEFKTHSSNGTLFYLKRRNDDYDMISGEIIDGFLEFKIRCKSSYANLRISSIAVDDAEWHQITFHRKHGKGVFMLDGIDYLGQYYVGCGGFTSLNIGNTNPDHASSVTVRELQERNGQMSACVRNVNLSTGISAPPHYIAVSECV